MRRRGRGLVLGVLAALSLPTASLALGPDELLADPALEGRARQISAELRCLVCQNQSIDDSDAQLARDLRTFVRDRLKGGDSDRDVLKAVVDRYGEFVLLRPVLAPHTALLWLGPAAILLLAAGSVAVVVRARRTAGSADPPRLSDEEEARLRAALERESG